MCTKNYFDILPIDVFLHNIISYIANSENRIDLNNLSKVCKGFRKLLFSIETIKYWNMQGFDMCIDDYCPYCPAKKSYNKSSAFKVLSKCPIKSISIHCFIDDIPTCLSILSKVGIIENICLTLTNKSNSPTLDHLLSNMSYTRSGFNQLTELIIHSKFLQVVATAGRSKLLDIVGHQLLRLSFCDLSSSNIFSIIQTKCPHLEYLRVDRIKDSYGLAHYQSSSLKELDLRRCDYVFAQPFVGLPVLIKLRVSFSFRLDSSQIISIVRHVVPPHLQELTIELPCTLADLMIRTISKRLHHLQCLTLEGAFEEGYISTLALESLGVHCKHLRYLNIDFARSMDSLAFEDALDAFVAIVNNFKSLQVFRCHYSVRYILGIKLLLTSSKMLKKVILWEKSRWMEPTDFQHLQETIYSWIQLYPHITLILEDTSNLNKKNRPAMYNNNSNNNIVVGSQSLM